MVKFTKVVAMDANASRDQERLWRSGKAKFASGLLDDSDWKRLMNSLWINAGRPAGGCSKDWSQAKDDKYFFKDRRNWSLWNLTQLYIHHEETDHGGMRALARLQLHTARGFKSVLKQPIRSVSLLKSASNMS